MRNRILPAVTGAALLLCFAATASAGSSNGSQGDMPAFYDAQPLTINFKELPPQAEEMQLAHNASINFIYMSDGGVGNGEPFISVLDAIQGDGFNPLWVEVQILFTNSAPRQFFSDDEILEAAAAGEITLVTTDEVYRCSVVGTND